MGQKAQKPPIDRLREDRGWRRAKRGGAHPSTLPNARAAFARKYAENERTNEGRTGCMMARWARRPRYEGRQEAASKNPKRRKTTSSIVTKERNLAAGRAAAEAEDVAPQPVLSQRRNGGLPPSLSPSLRMNLSFGSKSNGWSGRSWKAARARRATDQTEFVSRSINQKRRVDDAAERRLRKTQIRTSLCAVISGVQQRTPL